MYICSGWECIIKIVGSCGVSSTKSSRCYEGLVQRTGKGTIQVADAGKMSDILSGRRFQDCSILRIFFTLNHF
jgi:hypothetical protein